ncbi:efflux RND transporter periplasmic adaptor subunit [Wenzhouxiangella sp. XN24]|nr:efflux RND transporter periplasmic adaptor subunit [Wenzhouxiangella sp. XN24]
MVETEAARQSALQVTVEEEGRTRVKDRYLLHAPVDGYLRRIELEVGDAVEAGEVVALLEPLRPAVLDPRSRAEAEARVAAARAAIDQAGATLRQAEADARLAADEFRRREEMLADGLISRSEFDQARSRMQAADAAVAAATAAQAVARHELEGALARLRHSAAASEGEAPETVIVDAPVAGRVLRLIQESAGVVAAGQPLVEMGDPRRLEVVVEVLSRDAVQIPPGGRVVFERWGGERDLEGRVRTVEPTGFTKVSALGVEEQRVLVVADIDSPPEAWQRLGDGYRVEARFIVWERESVLVVPASALFRRDDGWAVFVVEEGRARLRAVDRGADSGLRTEILEGLAAGDEVVLHPPDELEDGTRVERYGT